MKTFFIYLIALLSIAAGNGNSKKHIWQNGYSMQTKSAKSIVMHKNRPLKELVILDDGSVLKPDGIVIRKKGYRFLLNDGECILQDGTIIGDD